MPKLSLFKHRGVRARRGAHTAAKKIQQAWRRRRGGYRKPKPGGRQLVLPLKTGYTYAVTGTGHSYVNFDADVGLQLCPPEWFTRYHPIFEYVRINKIKIEILAPANIGQDAVGTQSLYQMWSKKAMSTSETPPDSISEWLNVQNAKRTTFSGRNNSVVFYYTPAYETTVQPLNTAVTSLRLLYKQWQSVQDTPAKMTPHIGILGSISRLDGSIISSGNVFQVNVQLYVQLKGVKEL